MTEKAEWRRLIAEIEAAGTATGRARSGCCSLEGTRLFERALRAGARLRSAVTTRSFLQDADPRNRRLLDELESHGCRVVEAPNGELERLTQGRGIGALVGLAELPEEHGLDALLAGRERPLLLGSVGQDDPGNAGALVRTAHAAGAVGFLALGAVDPFHPKGVRTSMGSVFRLPIVRFRDLEHGLAALRRAGVHCVGSVTAGGCPLPDWRAPQAPLAMLLGSEAFGLSDEERAALEDHVTIPMASGVDSLSINAAAAVLLYAAGQALRAAR